ncbi:hypothetical protein B0O99DRAFT_607681 [Bisporella sp. PMI_857]|nr:hypothetical protein B0O99DRAFT_607681 [Bisporella sp. PMI_857]
MDKPISPSSQVVQLPPIYSLSSELWDLIFEKLSSSSSFLKWRLVSRTFDVQCTPFVFRKFILHQRIINDNGNPDCSRVKSHIYAHTRYIVLRARLDSVRVSTLLSRCEVLRDIMWIHSRRTTVGLPSEMQRYFEYEGKHVRLHFKLKGKVCSPRLSTIPAQNLTSFCASSTWHRSSILELATLLKSAENLERLYISHLLPLGKGKLPPIKSLSLQGKAGFLDTQSRNISQWTYTSAHVEKLFDFSRLTCLRLEEIPMENFIMTVPVDAFKMLRTFKFVDKVSHHEVESGPELGPWMNRLCTMIGSMGDLEKFSAMFCRHRNIVQALPRSLRVLELVDHPEHCSYLNDSHPGSCDDTRLLNIIRQKCPDLRALRLDLWIGLSNSAQEVSNTCEPGMYL